MRVASVRSAATFTFIQSVLDSTSFETTFSLRLPLWEVKLR